jgi:hypothetical protein
MVRGCNQEAIMNAKKHKILIVVLAISFVFFPLKTEAFGGWTISLRVDTGDVFCVAGRDGEDLMYAGTQKGLYVSSDAGHKWESVSLPGGVLSVRRVAITPLNVYLATEQGIFRKSVASMEWDRVPGRKTADGIIACSGGTDIVWVWSEKELLRVRNGELEKVTHGTSWEKITDVVYADGMLLVASGGNVYRSQDNGSSWEKIYLDWQQDDLEDIEEMPGEGEWPSSGIGNMCFRWHGPVFVSTVKGIFVIDNKGGMEGRIDTTGLPASKVKRVACSKEKLFASTDTKAFVYHEKERTWSPYFEESFPGRISYIKTHRDTSGNLRLWVAAGKFLYSRGIDDPDGKSTSYGNGQGPSIQEVHKMAIEYAEVSPEKIKAWRKGAMWKAILPRLSVNVSESYDDNIEIYKNSSTSYVVTGPRERGNDWGIDFTWDLSDLVWNDAQTSIDVRSRLMVQLRDDILEEVTRLYFERKRLIKEAEKYSKKTLQEKPKYISEKDLRIEELTAYIDALTGGRFSEALSNK